MENISRCKLYADEKIMETIYAEDVEYFKTCTKSDVKKIASRWWTITKGCYVKEDDMGNIFLMNSNNSENFKTVCWINI